MKISDVLNLEDGFPIPEVSGTLTAVYERKAGASDKGPWSFQDAELTDDAGNKIKLKLVNRPELEKDNRGLDVTLKCHKGDKGHSGLYALSETYNGRTTRKIKVTPSGKFIFGSDGSVSQDGTQSNNEFKEHIKDVVASNGHKPVFGGTAGCAVKLAVDILLESCEGEGISYYKSRAFSQDVYQISSDLVRVMEVIERGKLAPSAKEREALVERGPDNVVQAAQEAFQNEPDDWAKEAE